MKLTPAELTILGLLIERPMHGYDLEHVIEQRGIRQWTDIGFSSIYYLLTKLAERGLIETPGEPARTRSRRVFSATPAGREVAARNALALLATGEQAPNPFLVGLANLPLLTDQEYADALRSRLAQLDARIAAVEAAEPPSPSPLSAREVFSYSLSLMKAERSWLAARAQVSDG